MKNFFAIFGLLALISLSSILNAQVPTNGLVGYWPFNGNAVDASGNGHNGTVHGATLTTDRFGNANSAYDFVLTRKDYIELDNIIGKVGTSDFSISIWFLARKQQSYLICKRNAEIYGNWWELRSDFFGIDQSSISDYNVMPSNTTLILNEWYHYIITRSGNTLTFYVNGIQKNTINTTIIHNITNNNPAEIGAQVAPVSGVVGLHDGKTDDIRIYNRALNSSEINALYKEGSVDITSGLIAYYPFNGNANDESGNGNNGTVNGATLTLDRFGNPNKAYSFNGSSSFIQIPDNTKLRPKKYSISMWFKWNDYGSANTQFLIGKNVDNYEIHTGGETGINGLRFIAAGYPGTTTDAKGAIVSGWNNVVAIYNGTSSKIYINSILVEENNSLTNPVDLTQDNSDFLFGKRTLYGNYFNGKIDDIRFYDRELFQNEITALYNENICYQTITVTDTLIINANLSGFNPIAFQNTIKIFPNPTKDHITIDFGTNYSTMNGYNLKITNSLSQIVYTTSINAQKTSVNLSSWTGNGIYFVHLIDAKSNTIDIKKIVLQ